MADTETTEKKGKDIFTEGEKNEDGKYTEAPASFDYDKFKPIPKSGFVSDEVYLDHQANICWAKAVIFTTKAEKCEKNAAILRELGDPETRKKARKLQKMREQISSLEASLIADDVDITLL